MRFQRVLAVLTVLGVLSGASPAFAESKSTRAVQVSCTIPAQFEFAVREKSSKGSIVGDFASGMKSNLRDKTVLDQLVQTAGGSRRLVTVTAL